MKCLLLVLSFLSGTWAYADFQADRNCIKGATLEFSRHTFGEHKEKMDDEAYDSLCTANNASTAIECVKTVYSHFSTMRPWGLADVCSEGVSGEYAINCLEHAEQTVNKGWVASVDACNGITHKFTACSTPENKSFECKAGDAATRGLNKARTP